MGRLAAVVAACLVTWASAAHARAALLQAGTVGRQRARVVVLHSYHYGFSWSDSLSKGIREVFAGQAPGAELKFEFLDTRFRSADDYLDAVKTALAAKYAELPADVVIACDDNALDFMLARGHEVFPNVPVVFASASAYQPQMREQLKLTGLRESIEIRATVETALALHPFTKQLAIILDHSRTGRALKEKTMEALRGLENRVRIHYIEGLTVEQLKQVIPTLPDQTVVLLFIFPPDEDGRVLSHEQNLERIRPHCRFPIYAVWHIYLGHGIVGGRLTDGVEEGRMAARMALRVLSGQDAGTIPLEQSPTKYMFDYQELSRFGVPASRLPRGSLVVNKPFSFYEAYKPLIWSVIAAFVILLGIIIVLTAAIRARKRAQEALQQNEEYVRTTLDSIGDAVIATDTDGAVVRMNPVAETLTGWSIAEAVGRPVDDVFQVVDARSRGRASNPVAKVLATGNLVGIVNHTLLISRHGAEYQIADSAAPIRGATGRTLGVVLVFRDVTAEHALQQQLQHSQKMEAIGELAGGVAHDFNNMLGGMLGSAELLDRFVSAQAKPLLTTIMDLIERAAGLTARLLHVARKQPMSTDPVDVHTVLTETLALLGSTIDRRIKIEVELAASQSVVLGDPSQLQSAFLNLGINATHAMPNGGTLRVMSCNVAEASDSGDPGSSAAMNYLEIAVSDTGCGIPADVLPRIFEPFFTTKELGRGTGLGLAVAYGTIRQHGGTVRVTSEVGSGTRFRIRLPVTNEVVVAGALPPLAPVAATAQILVIDDEEAVRANAKANLEALGYRVVLAEDGKQALALFKANTGAIDLVLLDMIMPEMDGRECFTELRKIAPNLPIILTSGFSREEDVAQLQANGLAHFIRKPYRAAALHRAICEALTRPAG
jgi:two-component system, cell cycle sensor histidine kinase and response regulator CckA